MLQLVIVEELALDVWLVAFLSVAVAPKLVSFTGVRLPTLKK